MHPLLLVLDFALGLACLAIYRATVIRKGRVLDLWTISTLFTVFAPVILVGPFADSQLNYFTIGSAVDGIPGVIDRAFVICALGTLAWLAGALAFLGLKVPGKRRLVGFVQSSSIRLAKAYRGPGLWLLFWITLVACLLIQAAFGGGEKSLRDEMLATPAVRPFFNFFVISLAPVAFIFLVANYLDKRKLRYLLAGGAVALICLTSGARGIFFLPLVWIFIAYKAKNPSGSVVKLVLGGLAMMFAGISISALRSGGGLNELAFAMVYGIFYGNTFSDFRDFCWYLSVSDPDTRFHGYTYLAGLMSFVPTYLSHFREEFNLGIITATAIGYTPEEHAGIRLTVFGEPYINFGMTAVVVLPFVVSFLLKAADEVIQKRARELSYVSIMACTQLAQLPNFLLGSSSIFSLYVFILLSIAMFLLAAIGGQFQSGIRMIVRHRSVPQT